MTNIQDDTKQMKEWLSKADETGKIAWLIGQTAFSIKKNRSFKDFEDRQYWTFEDYTEYEFNKSEATIDVYIRIFKTFKEDDIGDLLYTHLKELSRISNITVRKKAAKVFRSLQRTYISRNNTIGKDSLFSADNIKQTIGLLNKTDNPSEEEIGNLVDEVLKVKDAKASTKGADKVGEVLKDTYFKGLERWLIFEPVDEQGTVALFCLLLPLIEALSFELHLEGYNRKGSFSQIEFVRSKFPDACIHFNCRVGTKPLNFRLFIEFEYYSASYMDHLMSKEKCHLIVCWINNIDRKKYAIDTFPPIIELRDVLKTGEIKIY